MTERLIAGCGYVGRRLARRLKVTEGGGITALLRSEESARRCEPLVDRVIRADLDQETPFASVPPVRFDAVWYLVAPPPEGRRDSRLLRFLQWLDRTGAPRRFLLVSTSGVYGDCRGEWVDESRPPAPVVDRAWRRLDAERVLAKWADEHDVEAVILRVAGIYGPGRLPVARLRKGLPMVSEEEAPWTNRIHVDDLVTVCVAAMAAAEPGLYNVSDGHPGNMTDYFNRVADAVGLPRPPLIRMAEAETQLSAGMRSYLRESRRLDNRRMLSIPGVELRYPTLAEGLAASLAAEPGSG